MQIETASCKSFENPVTVHCGCRHWAKVAQREARVEWWTNLLKLCREPAWEVVSSADEAVSWGSRDDCTASTILCLLIDSLDMLD